MHVGIIFGDSKIQGSVKTKTTVHVGSNWRYFVCLLVEALRYRKATIIRFITTKNIKYKLN